MAKKRINDDGIYFCGNNSIDVTGSCTYIKYRGKNILLECGMVQNNDYLENYRANSQKFPFDPAELDYVFIGHVHVDHIGMLPRLIKQGFKGKIITSHATAIIMEPLLLNSSFILASEAFALSKRYHRDYSPLYTEDDVYRTLDFIYEYDDIHKEFVLDDTVSFEWLENSHCVGARQLRLNLTDENGVTIHLLYTSDIGGLNTKNHYMHNTEIDDRYYKAIIMESTYGEKGRVNKKTREFDLEHLRVAADTVLERGGTLLLPCFSFSRTQEILTSLYEIYHNKNFPYDIVVDSMLSCDICNLYDEILDGDDLKKWRTVKNWENVHFIKDKDVSITCVKDHRPKIILSSSGFCTNGRILSYLHEYLSDEKSMVAFTGYVGNDNSYLSYRIKNYKDNKIIKVSGDPVENKADCISLCSFSSHASRKDLIEFGSSVNTEKLILVHGSTEAKNDLKESLKEAISKKDKSFKVVAATKDMFIRL